MATTTNYGWTTPDDTSLVKDGASAIRTLGSSVDTTVKNLNPETTLGDISYRSSTANTNTRLAIGTTGQVLTVSGGVPAWSTISAGGMTSLASGSLAASGTGLDLQSISNSYNELVLYIYGWSLTVDSSRIYLTVNNTNTGTKYAYQRMATISGGITNETAGNQFDATASTSTAAFTNGSAIFRFPNYKSTTSLKMYQSYALDGADNMYSLFGIFDSTSAIDRITLFAGSGSFDAGTYELFGVK